MTNDKTVTMSRELAAVLERNLVWGDEAYKAQQELRSLIAAKSESYPCWSCKAPVTMANRADADGNCPHCEAELDLEDWPAPLAAPVVERQEPVGEVADMKYNRVQFYRATGDTSKPYLLPGTKLYTSPPAPVAAGQHPFADKVISKLRRFEECASDSGADGVDIGRHWLDLLTQLGLLNRVQRSPTLWEITQQGEDCLDKVKELDK